MPSIHQTDYRPSGKAEMAFYEAFERLKLGRPDRLAKNASVTQNNVAKEAGCDPSALKKARYPELVKEIQQWSHENSKRLPLSRRQANLAQQSKNRTLRERIDEIATQRDQVTSLLVEADAKILELVAENARLRAQLPPSNVTPLRGKPSTGKP